MRAPRELHVFDEFGHLGTFERPSSGVVSFVYDDATDFPISLSLPLDGSWDARAPEAFLRGLLPDRGDDILRMRLALGAASEDPFELLDLADTAGGLAFTSDGEPPEFEPGMLVPMTGDDLAALMESHSHGSAWWESDGRSRFSLAGTQRKFTVSRIRDAWFWPGASVPSTHIVKPDQRSLPGVSELEDFGLRLAAACGVPAAASEVIEAGGVRGLRVERFDRYVDRRGLPHRIAAEDIAQALGVPTEGKYDVEVADVVALLSSEGLPGDLPYDFMEQLAFSTYVGDADAHAKNFSVFLNREGVGMCPAYDVVPTYAWDAFGRDMAMSVNGKWYPRDVGLADWREEAEACGLDADRVCQAVREVVAGIALRAPQVARSLGDAGRERVEAVLSETLATVGPECASCEPREPADDSRAYARMVARARRYAGHADER